MARHIEALLLTNDCVVIPQFGGFVTRRVASVYVAEEDLFLPPYRTIGFNPNLQANDGLLVSSFMNTYHIDENEAKKILNQKVLQFRQSLLENGVCDFEGIGLFSQNEDGDIHFSPYESGAVCPDYYGLDAFEFPILQPATDEVHPSQNEFATETQQTNRDKHITIRISRRLFNYTASAVAAILLFVLFSPTAGNTDFLQAQKSQTLIPTVLLQQLSMAESVCADTINATTPSAEINVAAEQPIQTPATDTQQQSGTADILLAEQASGYCVVVASSISEKNARQYVTSLQKRGIEGARVYKKGKMIRVVFDGFETESAAYTHMNKLKRNYTDFETAWVLNLN
ncbi:MAG: SPOR domain-containing protein [Paraprevotella sp.]|nr:SPOR domain-containing protein [Paraprevotella sp.]